MLLAKLKDKLFNNRNSVEIESLEGDIDINGISLQECLEWANSLNGKIYYDEEDEVLKFDGVVDFLNCGGIEVNDINVEEFIYADIGAWVNGNEDSYFPDLTDQAGKFVKVNADEDGFDYGEVQTKLYRHQIQLVYTKSGVSYKCLLNIICTNSTTFEDLNELKGHYNGLYVGSHSNMSISDVDVSNGVFALVSISHNNVTVGDSNVSYTATSISSDTVSPL